MNLKKKFQCVCGHADHADVNASFNIGRPVSLALWYLEYKELLPKRKKLAISMFKKDKLSAQKAAQIAGIDLEDFIKEFKRAV